MKTIAFDELRTLTGYQRKADVERCLKKHGIPFFNGRNGAWTTIDLVNQAGGIKTQQPDSGYSPDLIGT